MNHSRRDKPDNKESRHQRGTKSHRHTRGVLQTFCRSSGSDFGTCVRGHLSEKTSPTSHEEGSQCPCFNLSTKQPLQDFGQGFGQKIGNWPAWCRRGTSNLQLQRTFHLSESLADADYRGGCRGWHRPARRHSVGFIQAI